MRLGIDAQVTLALELMDDLADEVGDALVRELVMGVHARTREEIERQRLRVTELRERLERLDSESALNLAAVTDALVPTSVWIVGGDGWAYDIGFGGLDHVLATGRDVNVLVLDTEVYSNTGGQASKATPRGAVAKFAAAGKSGGKKDLGLIATAYGNVYVAQIAMGADMPHTVKVLAEAETHRGPSLIIAYSHCIAHGMDMSKGMEHQKDAVRSDYWPLWRYVPETAEASEHPFILDSKAPTIALKEFAQTEARFAMLARTDPYRAETLLREAQDGVNDRRHLYEQMAGIDRTGEGPEEASGTTEEGDRG